jgi:hypothetical protein
MGLHMHSRTRGGLLGFLLALASSASAKAPAQTGLRWAWPDGATALVTETRRSSEHGKSATSSYRVRFHRANVGSPSYVDFEDYRIVDIDGRPPPAGLQLPANMGYWPIELDARGQIEGLYRDEEATKAVREIAMQMARRKGAGASIEQFVENPQIIETVKQAYLEVYCIWLCAALDAPIEPGDKRTTEYESSIFGMVLPTKETVWYERAPDGQEARVLAVMESAVDFEVDAAQTSRLQAFLAEAGADTRGLDAETAPSRLVKSWWTRSLLDARTLLPIEVRFAEETALDGPPNVERRRKRVDREFKFAWDSMGD